MRAILRTLRTLVANHVPQCHIDKWYNGSVHECTSGPPAMIFGDQLIGALGGSVIILAFYVTGNGRLSAPSVLLVLLAGPLIPRLPGNMVGYAEGIVIVGLVAGLLAFARKYILSPGT